MGLKDLVQRSELGGENRMKDRERMFVLIIDMGGLAHEN